MTYCDLCKELVHEPVRRETPWLSWWLCDDCADTFDEQAALFGEREQRP